MPQRDLTPQPLPSEILPHRVVVFEESDEGERLIVRDCKVCLRACEPVYGTGVVSPSGIVHVAEYEDTLCGHDATGADWWWPL